MRRSIAAFWLLMVLIVVSAIVAIIGIIFQREGNQNIEILKMFFSIMSYAIAMVGGGYLGVQIGESK